MPMEQEPQFGIREALAIFKRRFWWIVIPALLGPVVAIGITFAIKPVYTSQTFVLIEQPKIPDKFVTQVVTDQLDARLMTLQEQILSRSRLEPIIDRLGLFKDSDKGVSLDEKVERLRKSIDVKMITPEGSSHVPSGFYITASGETAQVAQQVCTEILSMFMSENLKLRQQRAAGTTEFLSGQLEESKRKLDEHDAKLAEFKGKYLGQLPTDEQRNLEMLTATRTQLEALNQELSQAQQQKIIQESSLSQLNAGKTVASVAANPSELEQELATQQSLLASLQARYTDKHPDVKKTKAQIQILQDRLKAANVQTTATPVKADAPMADTAEARQLRVALRLTEENIRSKRAEQSHLEEEVRNLQARLQLSPVVEERYKALTRDYESALQFYNELLSKKTQSEMSTDLERRQEGEQFGVMDAPDLPTKPSFPNRLKFSLCGLVVGFPIGIGLAMVVERRENFIRNEDDVVKILGLAVLIALPEVESKRKAHNAPIPLAMPKRHDGAGAHQQAKV
jgi:polysaccharide chain length determinant protein (PEP-CTERM system associated)